MLRFLALALLASAGWAQTYVTVNGPIASGTGAGWNGNIVYSHPAWTCGDTSVGPETITIRVRGGIFSQGMLADCPGPYEITYIGTSNGKAYWTIPGSKAPATTIREIQSDYVPTPFWQVSDAMIAVPPGGAGKCRGGSADGKSWTWHDCGGAGGGGGTWGSIIGTLSLQLDLKTVLDGKAGLSHGHAISDVVQLQSELIGKEPAIPTGTAAQYVRGDKTIQALDTAAVQGLDAALAAKEPSIAFLAPGKGGWGQSMATADGIYRWVGGSPAPVTGDPEDCIKVGGVGVCGGPAPVGGEGIVVDPGSVVRIDDLVSMRYMVGSGSPGSLACTPGRDRYLDTVGAHAYFCAASGIWVREAESTEIPAVYTLPTATGATLGGVKVGANLSMDANGVLSATGGGSSTTGLYSGTLTFAAVIAPGACQAQTFAAVGLAAGRALAWGIPASIDAVIRPQLRASAADTVEVELCNLGDVEVTPGSATYSVRDIQSLGYLAGSGAITFGNMYPGQCSTGTVTVAGAVVGQNVAQGWPSSLPAGVYGDMRVTAPDTVTVRLCSGADTDTTVSAATYTAAIAN